MRRGPTISPDGKRLAVSVRRATSDFSDIYIKQLDHGPLTRITFEGLNLDPVWTPDGRSVVYRSRATPQAPAALRRRRTDGTGGPETLFAAANGVAEIVPTRDTAEYILRLANSKIGLARWHRGDTTATPLGADETFAVRYPALSPDGRWIAFASNASGSGRSEVFVHPYPDVNAGRWQVSQAGGTLPRWSHSGRELFYVNGARALVAATVVPGASFTLGAQAKLFDASPLRTWGEYTLLYDVAPDDQRFLMLRPVIEAGLAGGTRSDKLVQITNWTTEVQAKLAGKAPK